MSRLLLPGKYLLPGHSLQSECLHALQALAGDDLSVEEAKRRVAAATDNIAAVIGRSTKSKPLVCQVCLMPCSLEKLSLE